MSYSPRLRIAIMCVHVPFSHNRMGDSNNSISRIASISKSDTLQQSPTVKRTHPSFNEPHPQ